MSGVHAAQHPPSNGNAHPNPPELLYLRRAAAPFQRLDSIHTTICPVMRSTQSERCIIDTPEAKVTRHEHLHKAPACLLTLFGRPSSSSLAVLGTTAPSKSRPVCKIDTSDAHHAGCLPPTSYRPPWARPATLYPCSDASGK
ncbi:MAG: hypothetical protein LQ349_000024 [Xanthoria aureola]|nr:MAG: hypothetical protein LQ349_000024 [Xanthoria aureola]